MVSNLPLNEVIWDHPDREDNPLPSAPSQIIFSDSSIKHNNFESIVQHKKINVLNVDRTSNEISQKTNVNNINSNAYGSDRKNFFELYKIECQKNEVIKRENDDLKLQLLKIKVKRQYKKFYI